MRFARVQIPPILVAALAALATTACGPHSPIAPPQTSPDVGSPPTDPDPGPPPPPPVAAGTWRVALGPDGALPDGDSAGIDVSFDGRFVAFASEATNLVEGDTNGAWDVFVRDLRDGTTERVSIASDGRQGDGDSRSPSISADGRLVAFESSAGTLGGNPAHDDVFVRDRETGTTELVSVAAHGGAADGPSWGATISDDGRYVVFRSEATDLLPSRAPGGAFVRDRVAGTTTRILVEAPFVVSRDGRHIAYLDAGPVLMVHELATGQEQELTLTPTGAPPDNDLVLTGANADASVLGFHSLASNLVSGVDEGWDVGWDVFVHDGERGATELVSIGTDGRPGDNFSFEAIPDASGRHVLFTSLATDLVPEHDHVGWSLYVRDREADRTERVPVSTGPTSLYEFAFTISGDGRHVVFTYEAAFDNEGYLAGVEGMDAHPQGVREVFVHTLPAR